MFDICRKIVAGPKKMLVWNGKQLDLTYVTDRIIAMAFPASGLQKVYRNSINDVSQYLQQKHGDNYLIVNVSSRKYDYKYFNNNVLQYEWKDHLSPPLSTLFQIGREMYDYMKKNKNNVVAVHCNHGKGRTGTTIIAFLLFTGFFQKYDEALSFYNKRRFISLTYGVSQPCQKRYLSYFETLKSKYKISQNLISYKLRSIKQKGLQNGKYFLQIRSIRNQQPKYMKLFFCQDHKKLYPNVPLMGDICIQIYLDKWKGENQVAMINCHTYFLSQDQSCSVLDQKLKEKLCLKKTTSHLSISTTKQKKFNGKNIKVCGKHSVNFQVSIDFQWYCKCHMQGNINADCPCQTQRKVQQKIWQRTIQNVQTSKKIDKIQSCSVLFNYQYLHQQNQQPNQQTSKKQVESGSNQSSKGTSTSPLSLIYNQQKQLFINDKVSSDSQYQSRYPGSFTNNTQRNVCQKGQFEYDMIIVNRNSTNSV